MELSGDFPSVFKGLRALFPARTNWGVYSVELVVSTPTSGSVVTSDICLRCPLEVEGRSYKVNLFCLPLSDLDVILGMD